MGEMGTVVTGRAVFAGVDVSGKVRLFGEQETDSSRIRFSGEADESTLLLEVLLYCEPCLEGFQTVIIKKVLIDFLQVIVKSSSLLELCNTRFTYIGRSRMNNKLKRTDFFENFKLSTTLNEIFVVVVHDR